MASPSEASPSSSAPGSSLAPSPAESPPTMGMKTSRSFALMPSPSGNNLFVQAAEFDPLEPHGPRDAQGEGMGFLFRGCFSWLGLAGPKPEEPAKTAERHYSLPPSESMVNLLSDKDA